MKNYEVRVYPKKADDGSTYWTAVYPSIPGCVGGGDTPEEAIIEAQENLEVYLEYLEEEKRPIPAEDYEPQYSGKIAFRTSRSTHKRIAEIADREGISINLLINNAIERYIGEQQFDLNFYKKLVELKAVADSSLLLQQYNASFNHTMWDKVFDGVELVGTGDWQ